MAPAPLAYRFKEPVVVHPAVILLVADDGDATGGHERQLEDLPLLVGDLTLHRGHSPLVPDDRHPLRTGDLVIPHASDAAEMPLEPRARPFRLGRLQVCRATAADLRLGLRLRTLPCQWITAFSSEARVRSAETMVVKAVCECNRPPRTGTP